MKPIKLPLVLSSALFLTACASVGPDFKTPDVDVISEWEQHNSEAVDTAIDVEIEWWKNFNDPILTQLIDKAYHQNLSLQGAGLRVYEARAILGFATGSLYPQRQGMGASSGEISLSENGDAISGLPPIASNMVDTSYERYSVGLDAAWELDFWGKFRRGVESADANLAASIAGYDHMLVSLTGEVASIYTLMRSLEERLSYAQSNVQLQQRSLEIASIRQRNGLVTELDVQLAQSLLSNTKSRVPQLKAGIRQARLALSQLLGMPPSDLTDILGEAGMIPSTPEKVAVGIPAELLRRRPDIRQMELLAAAQSARIGVAEADLYPALRLAGTVGYSASSTGDLVDSDSGFGMALISLDWKVLNYGRLESRIRVEDARFQQAITAYKNSVLNAAREVETGLTGFVKAKERVVQLQDSVRASRRAVELAQTQYRDGIISYTLVLDAQQFLLLNEDQLTSARGDVAKHLIATYKAIGGGWQIRENQELIPDETKQLMRERTDWDELLDKENIEPVPENERGSWRLPDM